MVGLQPQADDRLPLGAQAPERLPEAGRRGILNQGLGLLDPGAANPPEAHALEPAECRGPGQGGFDGSGEARGVVGSGGAD